MKVFVEFATADGAARALATLKSIGYLDIDTHTPFPLTMEQAYAPRGAFPLAAVAFAAGLSALVGAYLIQWYANVGSYALDIGGRPAHAGPAFVPATFESICLLATVGVALAFLLLERLPRLWQPVFEIDGFDRASVDRFWVVLDLGNARVSDDGLVSDIAPLEPIRIIVAEGDR